MAFNLSNTKVYSESGVPYILGNPSVETTNPIINKRYSYTTYNSSWANFNRLGSIALGNGKLAYSLGYNINSNTYLNSLRLQPEFFSSWGYNPPYSLVGITETAFGTNSDAAFSTNYLQASNYIPVGLYESGLTGFGFSLAIGYNKLFVGAPGDKFSYYNKTGSVYVFDLKDVNNIAPVKISPPTDDITNSELYFGYKVIVGENRVVISMTGAPSGQDRYGRIYIYDLDFNLINSVNGSYYYDRLGDCMAIGQGRIVVGITTSGYGNAYGIGERVEIYDLNGNLIKRLLNPDINNGGSRANLFGASVSVGCDRILVSAPGGQGNNRPAIYMYDLDGNLVNKLEGNYTTGQTRYLFGEEVAISNGRIAALVVNGSNSSENTCNIYDLNFNLIEEIPCNLLSSGNTNPWYWVDTTTPGNRLAMSDNILAFGIQDSQDYSVYGFESRSLKPIYTPSDYAKITRGEV